MLKRSLSIAFLCSIMLTSLACNSKKNESTVENTESQASAESNTSPFDQVISNASFVDLEGKSYTFDDFKGKVVMLDLWATWCGPCVRSFPTVEKLNKDFEDKLVVIALSDEDKETVQKFVDKNDYSFFIGLESEMLKKKFNAPGIPFKVFIDPDGKFITSKIGSYGPEKDYAQVAEIVEKYAK